MTHQEMEIKIKELEKRIKALEQESKTEKVIKMCNVTPEEREIINKNIKSISKPTGVNFLDLYKDPCEDIAKAFQLGMAFGFGEKYDEMDKVIEEVKKAVTPQPCEDYISRQAVLKQLKGCLTGGDTEYNYVKRHIDSIPPVNPQPKIDIDKLRAEIEQMDFDFGDYYDNTDAIIEMVCKVIDKYKEESEE